MVEPMCRTVNGLINLDTCSLNTLLYSSWAPNCKKDQKKSLKIQKHKQLHLHIKIRLLSQGKVLNHIFALHDGVRVLLMDSKFHLKGHFNHFSWLVKVMYLTDIFNFLNQLDLSLQVTSVHIFKKTEKTRTEKKEATIKKIKGTLICKKYFWIIPNIIRYLTNLWQYNFILILLKILSQTCSTKETSNFNSPLKVIKWENEGWNSIPRN